MSIHDNSPKKDNIDQSATVFQELTTFELSELTRLYRHLVDSTR